MLSYLTESAQALKQQTEAQEKAHQESQAIMAKMTLSLQHILKSNQDLVLISKKSLEKLSHLERRADAAGGEPADISRHLSQWLSEYSPELSRGDPAILKLGLIRQQSAFQRSLEGTKMSATLPAEKAFQVALSIIAETLRLQHQNAILSAQSSRKNAEFDLRNNERHAQWLKTIESNAESKGYTPEQFQHHQKFIEKETQKEHSNISYWQEAERQAIAQKDQTMRTLADPKLVELMLPEAEVEQVVQASEGLFSVWLKYWKTETTKEQNFQSRLEVEVELSEPETVTMDNLVELRKNISDKGQGDEANGAQGSQA